MNIGQIRIPVDSRMLTSSDRISGKNGKVISVEDGKIQILIDDKLIKIEAGKFSRVKPGDSIQVFFEKDIPAELEGKNLDNLKAKLLEVFSLSLPFKSSEGIQHVLENFSQGEKVEFARLSNEIANISKELLSDMFGEEVKYTGEKIKDSVSLMDASLPYDRRLLEFALRAKAMGKSWSELPQTVKKELVRAFVFYDVKERMENKMQEGTPPADETLKKMAKENGENNDKLIYKNYRFSHSETKEYGQGIIKAEENFYADKKTVPGKTVVSSGKVNNNYVLSEKISGENIKITGETVKDLNGVSDKDLEKNKDLVKEFNIKKIPDMLKGVSETQVSKTGGDESNGVADAKSPLSGNSGNLSWPDVDSNYKGFSDKFVKNLNSIYVSKELPEMLKNYTGKLFRILSDSLSEPVNIKKFVFSETKNGIGQLNNDIHGVIRDITRLKMLDEDKVETLNILKSLIEPTIRNDKRTLITENGVKENADLKSDLKSLFDFVKLNGIAEKQAKEIIAETARVAVYFSHESNSKSYLSSKDAMSNIIGRSTDIMLRKILDSGRFTEAKADFHRNSFKQNEPVQNEKNESFMNQLKKAIAGIFEKASGKKYELNPQGNNLSGKTEFARADRNMEKSIESDVKMQTDTIRKEQATPESQRAENIKEESETVKEAVKNTSVKTPDFQMAEREKPISPDRESISEESKFQRLVNIQTNNYETVYSTVFNLGEQSFRVDFYGKQISEEKYEKNRMYRVIIETNTQLLGDVVVDTHFSNNEIDVYIYSEPEYADVFTKHSSTLLKRMKREGFAVKNIYIRNKPRQTEIIEKKTKYVQNEMKGEFFGFA